jgi:hypothetical protein
MLRGIYKIICPSATISAKIHILPELPDGGPHDKE